LPELTRTPLPPTTPEVDLSRFNSGYLSHLRSQSFECKMAFAA
jgi:hypothetical protein